MFKITHTKNRFEWAIFCLLLLGSAVPGRVLADTRDEVWSLEQVMQDLSAIKFTESTFTETKRSSFLTKALVLHGRIRFRAPNKLVKHILRPYQERIAVDGDQVTIEKADSGTVQTFSLDAYPTARTVIESVRATLAGDLASLKQHFHINLWGKRRNWTMQLIPKDSELTKVIASIRIYGKRRRVVRIETVEADGDESVMDIAYSKDR